MPQQQLRDIEKALTNVYLKIFREIKKDENYPNNLPALKKTYNRLVYDNTRAAVQQAVFIGIEQVNRKLKTQSYITRKDIEVIETNTNKQVASFWRKVEIAIAEEFSPLLVGGGISDYFSATAISSVFTSLADAVVSKVNQTIDLVTGREKPRLEWITKGDSKVCPICQALDGREFDYDADIPRPGEEGTHYNCRCQLIML
jgi:SPP1 gp7 family putative phage head morphogenesis protein